MHNRKTPSDNAATAENFAHFFRRGIGSHIKVFWLQPQQQIAYRTAHHISLKTGLVQTLNHFFRRKAEHVHTNTVFGKRQHHLVRPRGGFLSG